MQTMNVGESTAVVLSLPIRVKTPGTEDKGMEGQDIHEHHEQRFVTSSYNPYQDDSDNENDEEEPSGNSNGFLSWNGNGPNMMLRINDYFDFGQQPRYWAQDGSAGQSQTDDEEDNDGGEERGMDEPQEYQSYGEASPTDEDFEQTLHARESYGFDDGPDYQDFGHRSRKRKRKRDQQSIGSGNFEGIRGGIYGTDTVVHLQNGKSSNPRYRNHQLESDRQRARQYRGW